MKNQSIVEYYSNIEKKSIDWLWYPYIPYGKITILQGDPGEGKSTFILHLAALLSKGEAMPDGYAVSEPQKVIYQCAEDGLADTIKPRLEAAGADCSRIGFIKPDDSAITIDDKRIEIAIEESGARLCILDPIQSFITQDGDMQSATRMRSILGALAAVAARNSCAVVLVGHMTKGTGTKNLYRGLGSIDIAAIARSILMISRDQFDPTLRYMYPVKSSLAPEGSAIGFRLTADKGFEWSGPCEIEDVSEGHLEDNERKHDIATEYLLHILSDKDMPSATILENVKRLDIGERTLLKAKKALGICSYKAGNAWYWTMNKDGYADKQGDN